MKQHYVENAHKPFHTTVSVVVFSVLICHPWYHASYIPYPTAPGPPPHPTLPVSGQLAQQDATTQQAAMHSIGLQHLLAAQWVKSLAPGLEHLHGMGPIAGYVLVYI